MALKFSYMEDDENSQKSSPAVVAKPRVPSQEQEPETAPPPMPGRVPPPPLKGHWFVCANESCSQYGHVGTGGDQVIKRERTRRCPVCKGLGVEDSDSGSCEECGGRGKIVIKKWTEPIPVVCPVCRAQMMPIENPVGYPRIGTPHSDKDDGFSGNVSFGRTRKISLE